MPRVCRFANSVDAPADLLDGTGRRYRHGELSGSDEISQLGQDGPRAGSSASRGVRAPSLAGSKVDDRLNPCRFDSQLEGEFDVAATERVDEADDAPVAAARSRPASPAP